MTSEQKLHSLPTEPSQQSKTTRKPRAVSASASRKPKSSETLWDSMDDPSTASWIASLRAGRASLTPSPASASEPQTNAGSGQTSPELLTSPTPGCSSGKTSQGSFGTPTAILRTTINGETTSQTWTTTQSSLWAEWEPFSGIWPRWGLCLRGEVYELPKWAPHTAARGSLSLRVTPEECETPGLNLWGTPQSHDANGGDPKRVGRFGTEHGGRNLADDVTLWRPPDAPKTGGVSPHTTTQGNGHQVTIAEQAEMWMTPSVPNGGRKMTPEDVANKGATSAGKRQVGLENQTEFWKTPHGLQYKPEAGDPGGGGEFAKQVENWQSPTARDWKSETGSEGNRYDKTPNLSRQVYRIPETFYSLPARPLPFGMTFSQRLRILLPLCRQLRRRLPSPYRKAGSIFRRKLNPDFVDWLMGWPAGWSSAGRAFSAEEMESYLSRQRLLLRYLLNG